MSHSFSFPAGFLGLYKWRIFEGTCTQDTNNIIITVIVAAVIMVLLIEELRDCY
jgi:hypothetical protein